MKTLALLDSLQSKTTNDEYLAFQAPKLSTEYVTPSHILPQLLTDFALSKSHIRQL